MDFMLIDAKYEKKEIYLNQETLEYCKKFKVIALYGAVQFISSLDEIISQLEKEGIKVISSQPERTNKKYQVLGCDAFHQNLGLDETPEAYLYVGDGVFHPRALVLAQKDQPSFKIVIRYDPIADKMILMDEEDCKRIFKKYKAGLMKFMTMKNIGVVVTTKPGQQQFRISRKLREKFSDKNIYFFAEDTLDFSHLEDFNFIDVWINSACPRIGFDDAANIPFDMINLTDAFNVEEVLSRESVLNSIK
jgi:diphthamide biosynthesis enzyme Dph1/Dph2-like protein